MVAIAAHMQKVHSVPYLTAKQTRAADGLLLLAALLAAAGEVDGACCVVPETSLKATKLRRASRLALNRFDEDVFLKLLRLPASVRPF